MRSIALLSALLLAGCAKGPPLPHYSDMEPAAAVAILADRESRIRSASGEGAVTLTRPDGQSVRLDTAVVAEFPNRVRLRSWKMGQAVFDMTLTPEGVWMLVADPKRRDRILPAGASTANFMRGWSMLHGAFYSDPSLRITNTSDDIFHLERKTSEGQTIRATVDRDTLTVRRHAVLDDKGTERFSLEYDRYRLINGIAWPMRMKARSGQGLIEVELDEVQLNLAPPPTAFVPPRRAEKLP